MQVIRRTGAALTLMGLAALSHPASAQTQFNGAQSATYTGSNFTISGNTITAGQTATAGTLNFGNGAVDLLGINGIWVVSPTGDTLSGLSALTGGPDGGTAWTPESSPAGFGGQPGYSPNKNWITLAPLSDFPSATGNTPSDYTSGTFTFSGLSGLTNYDLGVDYLLKNGQTGRAYFHAPSGTTPPPPTAAVPEAGSMALFALGGLALLPVALRARRGRPSAV